MADRTSTSTTERVCAETTSAADFHDKFVRTRRLCVLTGAQSGWRARYAWQPETLAATLGAAKLRVDDRPAVTLTLAEYLAYADANGDERPLSIFDSEIVKSLAEDYTAPAIIEDGSLFADDPAPPTHRWFLVGAARTGTPLHTDPLATSAWNALVVGRKRWALFPPAAAGDASDDEKLLAASARLGAAEFFDAFVPLTLEPSWRGPRPLLLTQRAGETVRRASGMPCSTRSSPSRSRTTWRRRAPSSGCCRSPPTSARRLRSAWRRGGRSGGAEERML